MFGFSITKISASFLIAGILAMVVNLIGEMIDSPKLLAKNSLVVAGVAEATPATAPVATEASAAPPIAKLLASASATHGQEIAQKCQACHNFDKDGPNKIGPNLWGIVGNIHAHLANFSYSQAIAGMKGQPWTYDELNKFLTSPKDYAPGTKMTFAGLAKPEDRAAVIAYLRALSDKPEPLPQ